jgi:hypothetical protein
VQGSEPRGLQRSIVRSKPSLRLKVTSLESVVALGQSRVRSSAGESKMLRPGFKAKRLTQV